jgi:hypothetical protein
MIAKHYLASQLRCLGLSCAGMTTSATTAGMPSRSANSSLLPHVLRLVLYYTQAAHQYRPQQ